MGFHQSRASFEGDGDRDEDADLLALGLQTVRMTWSRFRAAPEREVGRLHAIFRLAGAGAPRDPRQLVPWLRGYIPAVKAAQRMMPVWPSE